MEDTKRWVPNQVSLKKGILYAENHGKRQAARELGTAESNIRLRHNSEWLMTLTQNDDICF